jgi:hypothetical protein
MSVSRLRLFALLALVGALAVITAVAQAGPIDQGVAAMKVSMTSVPGGPFTSEGHVLCPSGDDETPFAAVRPHPNGNLGFLVIKKFTCDDGSGTVEMLLDVHSGLSPTGQSTNVFRWLVTGGTGAYADLEGFGTGFQEPRNVGPGWVDIYNGRIGTSN